MMRSSARISCRPLCLSAAVWAGLAAWPSSASLASSTADAAGCDSAPAVFADGRECELIEKVCVDAADRIVNGQTISRPCWRYTSRYRCRLPSPEAGRCSAPPAASSDPISAGNAVRVLPADCAETSRTCTSGAEDPDDPACRSVRAELACSSEPAGAGITVFAPVVSTAVSTTLAPSKAELDNLLQAGCVIRAKTCADDAPREVPIANWPGHSASVPPPISVILGTACWEAAFEVACPSAENSSACSRLEEAGCRPAGEKRCEAADEAGTCLRWSAPYVCGAEIAGDGIETDGTGEVPDGGTSVDASDCEAKLEAAAQSGLSCTEKERTCVVPGRTEIINGSPVELECAEYQVTYACSSTAENGCEALEKLAQDKVCRLEAEPACDAWENADPESGRCLKYRAAYLCSEKPAGPDGTGGGPVTAPDAGGGESLGEVVESTGEDENSCSVWEADSRCALISDACTEGPAVKLIDGRYVYRDCWRHERVYACRTEAVDECAAYAENQNCRLIEETCPEGGGNAEAGACPRPTRVYECTTAGSAAIAGEACDGEACIAGVCAPVDSEPDQDFVEAVVGMEIGREAGIYGDVVSGRFFSGEHLTCIDRRGASSCCRIDASAAPSNAAFSLWLDFGAEAGWQAVKYVGSPYVYDILAYSDNTSWLLTKLYGTAGSGVYNPSFSYWGVTASYSAAEGLTFSFSPAGFALAAAMRFWGQWQSCRAEDQRTAMARGAGLCKYVGTTCEKAAGGFGCLESASHFVCFNSKLARIVNEEGRPQVGRGWGAPSNPETLGFTQEELLSLDFSKMDFSEFAADVVKEALAKAGGIDGETLDALEARAEERVEAMLSGGLAPSAPMPGSTGRHAGQPPADPASAVRRSFTRNPFSEPPAPGGVHFRLGTLLGQLR